MNLKEIGEFGLIDRIKRDCIVRPENVIKGIGDDCAVIRIGEGQVLLLTTDTLVEDIHFGMHSISPLDLGRKALAVNLSDIAAMGGIPGEALVSIAAPFDLGLNYLVSFYDGLRSMAIEHGVNIVGGNSSSAPKHVVINITLTGAAKENEVLYRSGAKVGDIIFVTGELGSSAAGVDMILNKRNFEKYKDLLKAQLSPSPHIRQGRLLAESDLVNSLIDISDGLTSDLGHICRDSGVGAIIYENQIPMLEILRNYINEFSVKFEDLALNGGEDYVLLGTMPEKDFDIVKQLFVKQNLQLFRIGEIASGNSIMMKSANGDIYEIKPLGYDHFKKII